MIILWINIIIVKLPNYPIIKKKDFTKKIGKMDEDKNIVELIYSKEENENGDRIWNPINKFEELYAFEKNMYIEE